MSYDLHLTQGRYHSYSPRFNTSPHRALSSHLLSLKSICANIPVALSALGKLNISLVTALNSLRKIKHPPLLIHSCNYLLTVLSPLKPGKKGPLPRASHFRGAVK